MGIGQVSRRVLPLLVSERSIRVHDVYVPQSVVLPIGEAKVRARVNTKLSTDTLVRRDVIRVVFLVERGVVRQRVLALNTILSRTRSFAWCSTHETGRRFGLGRSAAGWS